MNNNRQNLLVVLLLLSLSSLHNAAAAFNLTTISLDEGYVPLFGEANLVRSPDGRGARISLDRSTGSGFISSRMYNYGFFSANIKLPGNYTAGVCVTFYTSNVDVFANNHDELDFEFLGNVEGQPWKFQTNLYGNGSISRGREERYFLWFDPSKEFHRYSILWTAKKSVFYIDDIPIREVIPNEQMGADYPSKPMQLYATIWDGSNWVTDGGKYKVDYNYAPFVSEYKDFVLEGCPVDPIHQTPAANCSAADARLETADYSIITSEQLMSMRRFRERFMYYAYCHDTRRYPIPPPECAIDPPEKERFEDNGRLKFGGSHLGRKRRYRRRG